MFNSLVFTWERNFEVMFGIFSVLVSQINVQLNDRTSASKKINGMALIRTSTVSTAPFERTKEKFYGFWQTVLASVGVHVDKFFMLGRAILLIFGRTFSQI